MNVTVRIKRPCDHARFVSLAISGIGNGKYKITRVTPIEVDKERGAPEKWDDLPVVIRWLKKYALPDLRQQVKSQINKEEGRDARPDLRQRSD